MNPLDRLGVGLFTMQSTATAPGSAAAMYREFAEDAQAVEEQGLHSIWTAEHRIWYDGWCPAPLHAQAFAAARTSRVRFGNAMLLLPQHDPVAFARSVATLDHLSGGRVDLGVGLGHRDPEYDALGIRRDRRGRIMDESLAVLDGVWAGEHGDEPPVQWPHPPMWLGGMAPAAIARAARLGHGLMLPQTLRPPELRKLVTSYVEQAETPGTIGVMRDAWIEPDLDRRAAFRRAIARHYREESGAWWILKGGVGFSHPEQMERQLARILDTALVGPAPTVAAGLRALYDAGADFVLVRLKFDFVDQASLHQQIARLAQQVAPLLEPTALAAAESR